MTTNSPRSRSPFRVGDWVAHPESNRLVRGSDERHLPPMAMDLLVLLAEHPAQVVTKDHIVEHVWEGRFVSDSALTRVVAELRGLLDDTSKPPRYIETIPKRGYRLVANIERAPARTEQPALAVLPFDNLTHDEQEEFFADGAADAIITELGKTPGLRVISRQSTLRFKGTRKSLRELATELGVDSIVEGSVLRGGAKVRLTAQLVEVEPERHLWADSYECDLADVLSLQVRIARRIAASISAALQPATTPPRPLPRTLTHPDAHLAYLRGKHLLETWTREGFEKGMPYIQQALQIDPEYAPAHEQLALALLALGYFGYMPIGIAFPQGRQAALKAVALDDSLANAHVVLAFCHWLEEWDLAACEREMSRAIELNPSNEFARATKALFLITARRDARGMAEEVRHMLTVDPLGLRSNFAAAWLWLFARNLDRAAEQAVRTLELYPQAGHAAFVLALVHLAAGRLPEALAIFEPIAETGGGLIFACLGHVYARMGQVEKAREVLAKLSNPDDAASNAILLTPVYAGLGDLDAAFATLQQAFAQRDSRLFWVPFVPVFDPLRADPRFAALMAQFGAPA